MMHDIHSLQQKIIGFLPDAIDRVIHTYNDFVTQDLSLDAKEFSNHHSACKAAINHLESLLKILKNTSVDQQDTNKIQPTDISLLIQRAKQDLENYERDNKPHS